VILLLSNRRGWIWLPGFSGAPWNALTGSVFLAIGSGTVPAGGTLVLPPLHLPDDPLLQGFALTTQAVLFGSGDPAFSNGSTRIVGE
jgi:hypothetical protein